MMRQRNLARRKKHHRQTILTVVALVILVVTAVGIARPKNNGVEAETGTYIEYYVKPGDTLWDIAKSYSNNNVDLRDFVREIEEKNQLTSAAIYIGDMLLVPTRYSDE